LIIRPSLVLNFFSADSSFYVSSNGTEPFDLRLGSDFGFRYYLFSRNRGPYIQPQMGTFYYTGKSLGRKRGHGLWLDAMCYIGTVFKTKGTIGYTSIDAGVGYSYCRVRGRRPSLHFDINLGAGLRVGEMNQQQKQIIDEK
jgi:hypothetical protein